MSVCVCRVCLRAWDIWISPSSSSDVDIRDAVLTESPINRYLRKCVCVCVWVDVSLDMRVCVLVRLCECVYVYVCVYRGYLTPTTPAITGPVWMPTLSPTWVVCACVCVFVCVFMCMFVSM